MGGALAVLAAFNIARELQQASTPRVHVAAYTYGAPRVGNSAFAKEYDQLVTDTWSIVNDQAWYSPPCNQSTLAHHQW